MAGTNCLSLCFAPTLIGISESDSDHLNSNFMSTHRVIVRNGLWCRRAECHCQSVYPSRILNRSSQVDTPCPRTPKSAFKLFPCNLIVGNAITTVERCVVLNRPTYRFTGMRIVKHVTRYNPLTQVEDIFPAQSNVLLACAYRRQPIARVTGDRLPRHADTGKTLRCSEDDATPRIEPSIPLVELHDWKLNPVH